MKKIKTINKLLSSLTLLSPLAGIGFNNLYQNSQKVITQNNSVLNSYFNSVSDQRTMGGITVNVEGTTITGYVSGTGDLVVDSDITEIADTSFRSNESITSLDLSNATNLTTIRISAFQSCSNLTGNIVIPSSVTSIGDNAFNSTEITSLDLSQATSLTTINSYAFTACINLTGNLVIPSSVTSIESGAFTQIGITSLDLSQATSLTIIKEFAFQSCSNLTGDLVIPSSVTNIGHFAFGSNRIDNLYFLSETPPAWFSANWQPIVTGKVYVPSEAAKEAYLNVPSFGFNQDQVEIGLPPEPSKSNIGLILGLVIGLGIPVILAIAFIIWYATKKKKTTVKI